MRPIALLLLACSACSGGSAALAAGQAGQVRRGPQVALVTPTTAVVAWRSERPEIGTVEFGPTPALGSVVVDAVPATEHVLDLAGLQPGTRYFYRLRLDGVVVSEGHELETAAIDPAAPLRFCAFGDTGPGPGQAGVAACVLGEAPDLAVLTGDLVYEFGLDEEIDAAYFEPYAGLIDRIPFYACLGNHDTFPTGGGPLLDALYLPTNDATGSERFYSFDRGPTHFVALDTNIATSPGEAQHTWLEGDLAAARGTATWIVVFFHHPPYSSSNHGSQRFVQNNLVPVLERYGVDLVLTGHDHNYERTYPLVGGLPTGAAQEPDYVDPAGPVYVVTGGGGRDLYGNGASAFTAFSASVFHHVVVDVAGARLDLRAIDAAGAVIDRMSITKAP